MRGLFTKTLHEVWLTTLLFGFSLMAVMALLTYILPQIHTVGIRQRPQEGH